MKPAPNKANLTGEKFNRLTVIEEYGRDKNKKVVWLCKCDCGNTLHVITEKLRSGNTKSCGCIRSEKLIAKNTIHGKRHLREYTVWINMKKRCYSEKCKQYKDYGGRGIIVCQEWINDFDKFISDMGLSPTRKHSIDRIDNDGNYTSENCQWSTRFQQHRNTSRSKFWFIDGQKYESAIEAANHYKVTKDTIRNWCCGYKCKGKDYPPKERCYSELKYENKCQSNS